MLVPAITPEPIDFTMTTHQHEGIYYDSPSSRSPGSHRHNPQMLHRQSSRQFDAYGNLPAGGLFPAEEQMAQQNFAPRYDRVNTATLNSTFPFVQDPWGSFPAAQNNSLATLSATTRMKSLTNRGGRAGLPTVWLFHLSRDHSLTVL